MPNFSKQTFVRIGRLMGGADGVAPLSKLIAWSGIPRKSFYNWSIEPSDPQYREMPPVAKRLVTILAYFALTGQLTPQRLADIESLEQALASEAGFQKLANRMRSQLRKLDELPGAPDEDQTAPLASSKSASKGGNEAHAS